MADELPGGFDEGSTYFCSGSFLNGLLRAIRMNKVAVRDDGLISEISADKGTLLNAQPMTLNVCSNGETVPVTFWTVPPG